MRFQALSTLFLLAVFPLQAGTSRTFEATYTATIKDIPAGTGPIEVWVPLPVSRGGQTIDAVAIESTYEWQRRTDAEFGDSYLFTTIAKPPAGDLAVRVRFRGTRREVTTASLAERTATKKELDRALRADRLVTLSPRIRKLADEVTRGRTTAIEQARAIYDHLLATMKYDKTIPGWGQGDTERACDIRAGNCTDFHSLFISLARAKSIPARFVIGFPMAGASGSIAGYHCWAEFYVKGRGWIPVDPSEASKSNDPARRAYLFGNLDPERVQFTIGRDLVLSPPTAEPLNFFIYPRAESEGKIVGTPAIALEYRATVTSAESISRSTPRSTAPPSPASSAP